jgi:6-phosphogluconolactonase/glucosamine-6-phosphate isomerase/deaminase
MNPWEDSSIEKPIAGLDKSQYGGFSTDEYTFDYENDESYPETLREKLYDKGLGKLYIMRNIPFWSDALEATPYQVTKMHIETTCYQSNPAFRLPATR